MLHPHRNFHKHTWTSPDGNTHNQTDHILIVRRWLSSIFEVDLSGLTVLLITVWWLKT